MHRFYFFSSSQELSKQIGDRQTDRQDRNRKGKWECAMSYLHFTLKGRQVYVEALFDYGVHGLLLHRLKRFSPQSTYTGRGEIGGGSLSVISAGAYNSTLYEMVTLTIVKRGVLSSPPPPPPPTAPAWAGMYFARTWPLLL